MEPIMTLKIDEMQGFFVEDKQIDIVQNSYSRLHGVIQSMEGAIHPDILTQLKDIQSTIHQTFKPYWNAKDVAFDREIVALENVAQEHGLRSVWSMSSVQAAQMNEPCSLKIKKLTYESWGATQTRDIKGKPTWLEIWKIADEMMRDSGDGHHIFIEGFEDLGKGKFRMYAGS
jgi:hypothetical protein